MTSISPSLFFLPRASNNILPQQAREKERQGDNLFYFSFLSTSTFLIPRLLFLLLLLLIIMNEERMIVMIKNELVPFLIKKEERMMVEYDEDNVDLNACFSSPVGNQSFRNGMFITFHYYHIIFFFLSFLSFISFLFSFYILSFPFFFYLLLVIKDRTC